MTAELIINRALFGDNFYSTVKIVWVSGGGERRQDHLFWTTANVSVSLIFIFLLYLRTVTTLPSKCFCSPEPCSMKVALLCLKLLQRYLVLNKICTRIKRLITACSENRKLLARIVLLKLRYICVSEVNIIIITFLGDESD